MPYSTRVSLGSFVVQLTVAPVVVMPLIATFEMVGGVVSPPPLPPLTVTDPADPEHDTAFAEASDASIPVIPTVRVPGETSPAMPSVKTAKLDGMAVVPP